MATEADTTQLMRTKLYQPRLTGDLVPRPRLPQRLEARRSRTLSLVGALAGFGNTPPTDREALQIPTVCQR